MMTERETENKTNHKIIEDLNLHLADTYVLYLKTQNFHWNIKDPRFHSLHEFFEKQYKQLADQVDEIAERIRMKGMTTQGTMKHFLEITNLEEARLNIKGDEMIKQLANDHHALSKWLSSKIKETQDFGDEGTADMYIQLVRAHDKQAWMLESHLQRS